jgi:hypothetical protein
MQNFNTTQVLVDKIGIKYYEMLNSYSLVQYMYTNSIVHESIENDRDRLVKYICIASIDKTSIPINIMMIDKLKNEYTKWVELNNKTNIYRIKSSRKKYIDSLLETMSEQYQYYYISKWNFYTNSVEASDNKYNVKNIIFNYVYDFFGISVANGKLTLFVIYYDGNNMFTKKQYLYTYLSEYLLKISNIHYIRLDSNSDIEKQIQLFLEKIKYDKYVQLGHVAKIDPIINEFSDEYEKIISNINNTYKKNKIIANKQSTKRILYDDDDKQKYFIRSYNNADVDNGSKSNGIIISKNIVDKIIASKKYYHPNTKIDSIINSMNINLID